MISKRKLRVYLFIAILFSMAQASGAQTAMLADQTLRSNGRVNPSTLGLEMSIPLASYPGRAGMNVPIGLQYSSKVWRMEYRNTDSPLAANQCHMQYTPRYGELSASGWTTDMSRPYIEYTGWDNPFDGRGNTASWNPPVGGCGSEENGPRSLIRRITVHLPSGATHELRPDDNVVSFWPSSPSTVSKNGTYYSADGSNLIYVEGSGTYRLKLTDGSYLDFAGSTSTLITGGQARTVRYATTHTDKTGSNTITYNAPDSTYPNGSVTDSVGRVLEVPLGLSAPSTPTATNSPQEYEIPGFGSSTITYKLHWKELKGASAEESGLTNFSDILCYKSKWPRYPNAPQPPSGSCMLFSDGYDNYPIDFVNSNPNDGVFNPIVLTKVELPDGRSYKFGYDKYGQMNRIEYPTGGFETLTHSSHIKTVAWETPDTIAQANFGVVERKVYESSEADPAIWTYGITEQTVAPHGLIVRTTAPDNTKTDQYLIRGEDYITCMDDGSGMICNGGYGYASTLVGMPFEERILSSTDQLLSKTVTTWNETSLSISYGNGAYTASADWHPRTTKVEQIIYDPSTSQVISSSTTTDYEGDLNQRSTALNSSSEKQYGFTTSVGSLGSLVKSVEKSYVTGTNYSDRNLRSLPSEVLTRDAADDVKAKIQFSYDDSGFGVSGVYGLLTKTTNWYDIGNNLSVSSKVKYDSYGNATEVTDGRGNVTTNTFSSTYAYAYPTSVTTPIPDSAGTYGSSSGFTRSTTYDSNTGLPLAVTDPNGAVTEMEYDDPLLRPTKVIAPNGAETVTEYGAGTDSSTRWVKVTSDIDETNSKYAISWLDGLGRNWLSQSEDSAGDVFAVTCYDTMGRVSKTSNPFRNVSNPGCSSSLEWTTPAYDDLGRTISVTTPDSAVVSTTYSLATMGSQIGTVITVEDQADKVRRSITNALGQLTRVDEPNSGLGSIASPNQATLYAYDALNNLTTVTQGAQTRTFSYDALSRLMQATNPESGTVKYSYDDNSNLKTKWDARGIKTIYDYDRLNRVWKRCYKSVGTSSLGYTTCATAGSETAEANTPDVTYYYDNVTNAKGKLTKVTSSVSTTEYTTFDILGRVTSHKQTTDGNDYTTGYTYNLSGALIEQTYPSGRVVKNTYDAADGSLSQIQSKRSAETYRNFANGFIYNPSGAVTAMRLGNGRWENTIFNSRLQPTQIGLGNGVNSQNLLKLEYEYGATASVNNGNITKQTITVPDVAQPFVQTYTYDELNRLTNAEEIKNSVQQWEQTFTYDRFGNRNFNEAETTTLPKNCGTAPSLTVCTSDKKVVNPSVNTANNRLSTSDDYAFDSSGNTTGDAEGRTFVYDAENKQVSVSDTNGTIGMYFYDGDGKRIKKHVPDTGETTIFVYDTGGKLIQEYSTIVEDVEEAKTVYTTSDYLGSPRINTDATGQVISRQDYHPFGEEIERTNFTYGSNTIRKQFTGYERDGEIGLDFAQARYFNPYHGRFTTTDPIFFSKERQYDPQEINLYPYCRNNPLSFIDPDGKQLKGKDGKNVTVNEVDGKIVVSENATDDVKRYVELLNKSGSAKGISMFMNLARSETMFSLKIDKNPSLKKVNGETQGEWRAEKFRPYDKNGTELQWDQVSETFSGEPAYVENKEGDLVYKEGIIVIYEKNIEGYLPGIQMGLPDIPNITTKDYMVAVGSHGIFHGTDQQTIDSIRDRQLGKPNNFKVEPPAYDVTKQVLKEIKKIKN